jgi:hypothetical protein
MNVDAILQAFNETNARYMLIGGMNFFLRHEPVSTFDVDLWVQDSSENKSKVTESLVRLKAEWGPTEQQWKPVTADPSWMTGQGCFCLTSAAGAIDIFLDVHGLEGKFEECYQRAIRTKTLSGTEYIALADVDMLRCQEALPPGLRKTDRIRVLQSKLSDGHTR